MKNKKYSREEIKPKKYPEEKPKEGSIIWVHRPEVNDITSTRYYNGYGLEGIFSHFFIFDWFIDVDGAPNELKPLPYPESKPEENGLYWVHWVHWLHDKNDDHWMVARWFDVSHWDEYIVDFFIPYKLQEEAVEEKDKNEIWNTRTLKVCTVRPGDIQPNKCMLLYDESSNRFLAVNSGELTDFARHWIEIQDQLKEKEQTFHEILTEELTIVALNSFKRQVIKTTFTNKELEELADGLAPKFVGKGYDSETVIVALAKLVKKLKKDIDEILK